MYVHVPCSAGRCVIQQKFLPTLFKSSTIGSYSEYDFAFVSLTSLSYLNKIKQRSAHYHEKSNNTKLMADSCTTLTLF